jgi:hypothetical protein
LIDTINQTLTEYNKIKSNLTDVINNLFYFSFMIINVLF